MKESTHHKKPMEQKYMTLTSPVQTSSKPLESHTMHTFGWHSSPHALEERLKLREGETTTLRPDSDATRLWSAGGTNISGVALVLSWQGQAG